MGCTYSISSITLPPSSEETVKALLAQSGLEKDWPFRFEQYEEQLCLRQYDFEMSYNTSSNIDDFLQKLAKLLDGNEQDGQVLEYNFDGEELGYAILIKGNYVETSNRVIKTVSGGVRIGEQYTMSLEVEVIGLTEDTVAIIE